MQLVPFTESSLGVLQNFLGHFEIAAVAHAREKLTAEQKATLAAFARGELDRAAREELIPLLAHNTTALEFLAELLKHKPDEK